MNDATVPPGTTHLVPAGRLTGDQLRVFSPLLGKLNALRQQVAEVEGTLQGMVRLVAPQEGAMIDFDQGGLILVPQQEPPEAMEGQEAAEADAGEAPPVPQGV